MKIDWGLMLVIFIAIVAASLAEHLIIAPRMEHSPAKTVAKIVGPQTVDDFVHNNFPNATTV